MDGTVGAGRGFEHVLAAVVLLARIGDIGSTYLVSPSLRFESNPIARRLGWRFIGATALVCVVPYFSMTAGFVFAVVSFLVTASNLSKGWIMRALGEAEYLDFVRRAASRTSLRSACGFVLGSAVAFSLSAVLLLVTSGGNTTWSYWFAVGMLVYAVVVALYGCLWLRKVFGSLGAAGSVGVQAE